MLMKAYKINIQFSFESQINSKEIRNLDKLVILEY